MPEIDVLEVFDAMNRMIKKHGSKKVRKTIKEIQVKANFGVITTEDVQLLKIICNHYNTTPSKVLNGNERGYVKDARRHFIVILQKTRTHKEIADKIDRAEAVVNAELIKFRQMDEKNVFDKKFLDIHNNILKQWQKEI